MCGPELCSLWTLLFAYWRPLLDILSFAVDGLSSFFLEFSSSHTLTGLLFWEVSSKCPRRVKSSRSTEIWAGRNLFSCFQNLSIYHSAGGTFWVSSKPWALPSLGAVSRWTEGRRLQRLSHQLSPGLRLPDTKIILSWWGPSATGELCCLSGLFCYLHFTVC